MGWLTFSSSSRIRRHLAARSLLEQLIVILLHEHRLSCLQSVGFASLLRCQDWLSSIDFLDGEDEPRPAAEVQIWTGRPGLPNFLFVDPLRPFAENSPRVRGGLSGFELAEPSSPLAPFQLIAHTCKCANFPSCSALPKTTVHSESRVPLPISRYGIVAAP